MFKINLQQGKLVITIKEMRVLSILMQEIKIDDLEIIKDHMLILGSFTSNSFLVFLKLLSYNSLYRVELNKTGVNKIEQNLINETSVYCYIQYLTSSSSFQSMRFIFNKMEYILDEKDQDKKLKIISGYCIQSSYHFNIYIYILK